jgi:hypothetical protein
MKHTTYFNTFLKDHVNLNDYRLGQLKGRVDAVYAALAADPVLGPLVLDKIPQGSWPHQTIIKPRGNGEFDADFLLLLDHVEDWDDNPKAYPNAVYKALEDSSTYSSMPHGRRTRCVYLTYAAESGGVGCHLDIVPYVILPHGRHVIVDQKLNDWEPTSPEGFTAWVQERDAITGGLFRKVVRLMKYYKVGRDFNGVPSVILTTLLGNQVSEIKKAIDPGCYADLPTALTTIVNDMSNWLQANWTKPSIVNPGGDGTTFDKRWEEPTYLRFRTRMKTCAEKMTKALEEPDKDTSIALWQDIFGSSFSPPGASTSSASAQPAPVAPSVSSRLAAATSAASTVVHRSGSGG